MSQLRYIKKIFKKNLKLLFTITSVYKLKFAVMT